MFDKPCFFVRFVKLETRGFLGRNVDREDVEKVVSQMSYSDFLIFYYLAQSMDKKNFGDLIRYMSNEDPLFRCSLYSYYRVDSEQRSVWKSFPF